MMVLTAKLIGDWLLHKLVTLFFQCLDKFVKLRHKFNEVKLNRSATITM